MGARVVAMGRNMEALERLKSFSLEGRIRIVQNTGDVTADVKELTKDGPADVFFDISPGKAWNSSHFKSCAQALKRGGADEHDGCAPRAVTADADHHA